MKQVITEKNTVIQETLRLQTLEILPEASMVAPEGKSLCLIVNGEGRANKSGKYEGDIVVSITDAHTVKNERYAWANIQYEFRSAVFVKDGKLVPEKSVSQVVRSGSVRDGIAESVEIISSDDDFLGFCITGDGEYVINNAHIELTGDGSDDFVGLGAGLTVTDHAKVTINKSTIRNFGVGRGTAFVGGYGEVLFNDCELLLTCPTPTPEELQKGLAAMRMMSPPWSMGIKGYGRTTNLAGHARETYNRCHIKAENGWGVLSVDGAIVNHMYVKDSHLECPGSGYGVFSICDDPFTDYSKVEGPGCLDVLDHSIVDVATIGAFLCLGNASVECINGTVIKALHGVQAFRNCGGYAKINTGSVINSRGACFVIKGSSTNIECDDCHLHPENGVLVQLMDNDNVEGFDYFTVPTGRQDEKIEGRDLTTARQGEDVFVHFSNMQADGDIFNVTTNLFPNMVGEMPAPDPNMPPMEGPPMGLNMIRGHGKDLQGVKNLDVSLSNVIYNGRITAGTGAYKDGLERIYPENNEELSEITCMASVPINNGVIIALRDGTEWNVTGTSYMTSLTIEEGCKLKGTLLVNGQKVAPLPGVYQGVLQVDPQ